MFLAEHLQLAITTDYLLVRYPPGFTICSSALWRGGIVPGTTILNQRVGSDYMSRHPQDDMMAALQRIGADPMETVGLLTAAHVSEAGLVFGEGEHFRLWAIVTAGVGNALRAGCAPQVYPGYQAGTINTIVIIDGTLTDAAMINAVMTATEAKTSLLQDERIAARDGSPATGTSTDAVVIACTQSVQTVTHMYAGTATELGDTLAKAVYQATGKAIRRENRSR